MEVLRVFIHFLKFSCHLVVKKTGDALCPPLLLLVREKLEDGELLGDGELAEDEAGGGDGGDRARGRGQHEAARRGEGRGGARRQQQRLGRGHGDQAHGEGDSDQALQREHCKPPCCLMAADARLKSVLEAGEGGAVLGCQAVMASTSKNILTVFQDC